MSLVLKKLKTYLKNLYHIYIFTLIKIEFSLKLEYITPNSFSAQKPDIIYNTYTTHMLHWFGSSTKHKEQSKLSLGLQAPTTNDQVSDLLVIKSPLIKTLPK